MHQEPANQLWKSTILIEDTRAFKLSITQPIKQTIS